MIVTCSTCLVEYDDTYHWTFCPHDWFPPGAGFNGPLCACPHSATHGTEEDIKRFREFVEFAAADMNCIRETLLKIDDERADRLLTMPYSRAQVIPCSHRDDEKYCEGRIFIETPSLFESGIHKMFCSRGHVNRVEIRGTPLATFPYIG